MGGIPEFGTLALAGRPCQIHLARDLLTHRLKSVERPAEASVPVIVLDTVW